MEEPFYTLTEFGVNLRIKALPGASKTRILGLRGGRLRLALAAAPEGGKANGELTAFLAKELGCAKSAVHITSGEKSRLKTASIPLDALDRLLDKLRKLYE